MTGLVDNIYQNLFNHGPTAGRESNFAGKVVTALLDGKITVGDAVMDIANFATGVDLTTLHHKLAVADYFTSQTHAAGLGLGSPLPANYLAEAHAVVAATTSAPGSVAAEEAAIATWIPQNLSVAYTLTTGTDTIVSTHADTVIGTAGGASQTLTNGDSITGNVNTTVEITTTIPPWRRASPP